MLGAGAGPAGRELNSGASARVRQYALLAGLLLVAALATRRVEPVVLAAPLLTLLAVGVALARPPELDASARLDRDHAVEGEQVRLELEVAARPAPAELELRVSLPAGLAAGGRLPVILSPAGLGEVMRLPLEARRWGGHRVASVTLTARDRLCLFEWAREAEVGLGLRVYPGPEQAARLLLPLRTHPATGPIPSRARGEGADFAEIHAFQPGDQVRRINWRATGRRADLMVNRQHPERSSDLVLFVDSFTEAGLAEDEPLAATVRLAAALAQAHLRRRDRVGVIGFGGVLRWLVPGSGAAQLYRVLDALVDTRARLSHAWKGIGSVPPRTLPATAQVIAVSVLTDERSQAALLDLAARGYDLAVVEVDVDAFLAAPAGSLDLAARRLWKLRRRLLRERFAAFGVPVAVWTPGRPLAALLAELEGFRRSLRLRRGA